MGVKGFLAKKTVEKMTVLKSDYSSTLLEYIYIEKLPYILGCEDKGGSLLSNVEPWQLN